MLSQLAQLMLAMTALAPVALVYAATIVGERLWAALSVVLAAGCLTLVCRFVLQQAETSELESFEVRSVENADKDVLAFLLTYALPLISPTTAAPNWLAVAVFLLIVFAVLYHSALVHVNPLLAFFGYHFYQVGGANGVSYLLITTRDRSPKLGVTQVRRLSGHVWLEAHANDDSKSLRTSSEQERT